MNIWKNLIRKVVALATTATILLSSTAFAAAAPQILNSSSSQNGDSVNITFSVSQAVWSSVDIQDANGNQVKNLKFNFNNYENGPFNLNWDGYYFSGTKALTGNYKYVIYIKNTNGSDTFTSGLFNYNSNGGGGNQGGAPNVLSTSASVNNTQVTFNYNIDKLANTIWIDVYDNNSFFGAPKKTINGNQAQAFWDGSNYGGFGTIPNGTYFYKVSAQNSNGIGTTATNSFFISNGGGGNGFCNFSDFIAPNVTNLNVNPNNNYDPINQSLNISYTLDRNANVTIELVNSNNTVVKTITNSECQNSGWNSKTIFANNSFLSNGSYSVRVKATTNGGTDTEFTFLNVVNGGGQIGGNDFVREFTVYPELINPNIGESVGIFYNLNSDANITTEVLDNNGQIVRTLNSNIRRYMSSNGSTMKTFGSYNSPENWDGKNSSGYTVADGIYQIRMRINNGNNIFFNNFNNFNNFNEQIKTTWVEVDTNDFVTGLPANNLCAGFKDMTVSNPYCLQAQYTKTQGITSGYFDGTFRPNRNISRAEITKIILLYFKYNLVNDNSYMRFRDIVQEWQKIIISTATYYGIINGYGDGTFRPENDVNHAELLKIFMKASGISVSYCGNAQIYSDLMRQDNNGWFYDFACYAKTNGLVRTEGNFFRPELKATRGEAADLLYQFNQRGLWNQTHIATY